MSQPSFAMLTCACGAEQAVKEEVGKQGWRLAFSRPGFVTVKHDAATVLPSGIFVRTAAHSVGQSRDPSASQQLDRLKQLLTSDSLPAKFDQLHVFPKDRVPIGRFGFEPGIDEVSALVAAEIHSSLAGQWLRCDQPNQIAQPGELVLDVVLVEPAHWFFGYHQATVWSTRWPGGVQPVSPKHPPISRAYFKAAESIQWSGFPLQAGDVCVEIGSAPGGACGRLLELGMQVIGIDPADMDPRIGKHPKFRHIRARAGDLPRKVFQDAKWLLVDSNVKPEKTLTTVRNIVMHQSSKLRGLLITLKIGDYSKVQLVDQWRATIDQWNPTDVQVRQLARNKCEVCFAVTMC